MASRVEHFFLNILAYIPLTLYHPFACLLEQCLPPQISHMDLASQQTGQKGKAREDAPQFLPVAAEGEC